MRDCRDRLIASQTQGTCTGTYLALHDQSYGECHHGLAARVVAHGVGGGDFVLLLDDIHREAGIDERTRMLEATERWNGEEYSVSFFGVPHNQHNTATAMSTRLWW